MSLYYSSILFAYAAFLAVNPGREAIICGGMMTLTAVTCLAVILS